MTIAEFDTRKIIDDYLSTHDMVITEHLVIDARPVAPAFLGSFSSIGGRRA